MPATHANDMSCGYDSVCEVKAVDSLVRDWYEVLVFENTLHTVKVDTGAQANVIAAETLRKILPNSVSNSTNVSLTAYGGYALPVVGSVRIECFPVNYRNLSCELEFIVVDSKVKTVLGLDATMKLKFINPSSDKIITTFQSDRTSSSKVQVQANTVYPTGSETKQLDTLISDFRDVFDNTQVGCIKDYEYDIKMAPNSVPRISKSRPTPFATKGKIEAELERMVKLDIIEPVDEPTEWVNSYVVVEKGDKTRICLDPNALNKFILREHVHLPTVDDIYSEIRDGQLYSKLDLKDGYWQIPLSDASSAFTTFHTHIGRFMFKRLPFGLKSANEVFHKRVSQVFAGLEGVKVMYDDVLIVGDSEKQHNDRLVKALTRARRYGVKLNKLKCRFMLPAVVYMGHIISAKGIKVDPDKVVDILNMPAPDDKKGVQRLLGTLNFFSRYIPNMSTITHPIRELLGKYVPFHWTPTHSQAFTQIKQILANAPVLGYYNVEKDIILEADASSLGLGACILQDGKPIAYASRSLTTAQTHYAQIEKELLAIVFGCERFRQYLYGKDILVHTDHKPLVNTIDKPLHDNPKRIQRLLLRLQGYNLTLKYIPGKDLHVPDMLSRACSVTREQSESEKLLTDEADYQIHVVIQNLKCSDNMRAKIKSETKIDPELVQVEKYITCEWPQYKHDCMDLAKLYWPHRAELCLYDGFILFHDRIVIPKALRADLLNRLHSGHQGRERCKRLARSAVFWPNINRDIDMIVDKCAECLQQRNNPAREKLIPHTVPSRAWQKLGIDLFQFGGKRFQIVVDYFSKWIEVGQVPRNAVSSDVLGHLNDIFTRFGYPECIFSDGDSVYTASNFNRFCVDNEIDHDFSSATYAQSNGQAERAIQHVKNILAKCVNDNTDYKKALLVYRNTPLGNSLDSPAMLFFNRKLRTSVPCFNLSTEKDRDNRLKLEARQVRAKECYDSHVRKDERKNFVRDELILYKDSCNSKTWQPGQIVDFKSPNRSYVLRNSLGNVINRNRTMILPDKTRENMEFDIDIATPVNHTAHEYTNAPQSEETPAFDPPLRRTTRISRKPEFYGNPVNH